MFPLRILPIILYHQLFLVETVLLLLIQDVQQLIPQIMCPQCNKVIGTIIECSLHGMSCVGTKLSLTKLLQILQKMVGPQ